METIIVKYFCIVVSLLLDENNMIMLIIFRIYCTYLKIDRSGYNCCVKKFLTELLLSSVILFNNNIDVIRLIKKLNNILYFFTKI